ncbi:Murein hydrolase activator NlpD [Candidatus Erwinia haradaeae]|uniref:Murein hydrolase activator NlpD n=1 Tax=Candidatus Erwinia haradaeae TaxID=1922217 RepID=A0A451DC90_9GAMM|nr:murein hydrolase activator NlpD [Candidatus Erwinia haradaeae]VFP84033.1 Murein hydrolase activator NlpD [Candidatus Erwinia haradaeae]
MKLPHITTCVLVVLALTGCSKHYNTPTPVNRAYSNILKTTDLYYNDTNRINKNNTNSNDMLRNMPVYALHREFNTLKINYTQNVITKKNHVVYAHEYNHALKGVYAKKYYIVHPGDTLFYIAWITGDNIYDLAKRNHIPIPYNLSIGQKLQVSSKKNTEISAHQTIALTKNRHKQDPTLTFSSTVPALNHIHSLQLMHAKTHINTTHSKNITITHHDKIAPLVNKKTAQKKFINKSITQAIPQHTSLVHKWNWPTDGKIINSFSSSEGGNKGIDIAGTYGNFVVSAAYGRVVYISNALRGYGNLIIIKHDNNYLSAYAHNAYVCVQDKQIVQLGQKIATMGNTGTSSVRLHFEIRYKGKPVNPLLYLPPR